MLNITYEFIGGPNDGMVLEGRLGESSEAERYYLFSNRGAIGSRIKLVSPYTVEKIARHLWNEEKRIQFQRHFYQVTEHLEENEDVWVRAEYLPKAVKSIR